MFGLFKSRKFLLLLLDILIALITYFVGKYAGATTQDVMFVVGVLQPLFITIIIAITVEDTTAKRAGFFYQKGAYRRL